MNIVVVGTGKLANELVNAIEAQAEHATFRWPDRPPTALGLVVVHAGSGRELREAAAFCGAVQAPLLELATGTEVDEISGAFPIVVCPNTNILMLKFMNMAEKSAALFKSYRVTITESHQAGKTSVPGTALQLAASFGLGAADVVSVRDPGRQESELGIPTAHLARHAFHDIRITDGDCTIRLQARVEGASPYAEGVSAILRAVRRHSLENRRYEIGEFIDRGWI